MSTMMERVARALCRQYELDDGFSPEQADRAAAGEMHRNFLKAARAAIEVMRDPTNLMLKAAAASMSESKRPTPERVSVNEKHRIRYRAMIDAELRRQTFGEAVAPARAPEVGQ